MLGPFTFTFTLESEEFEKFEKVGCWVCTYQTLITTRAPDGANKMNTKDKGNELHMGKKRKRS